MAPKELGPFETAQKEAELLKKKVLQTIKDGDKTIKDKKIKDAEEKAQRLTEHYKNSCELKLEVSTLSDRVKALTEEDEPKKVSRYVAKKNQEVNRMEAWKKQLEEVMKRLLPEESEEEFLKKLHTEDTTAEDNKKDDDDDEDDDDEEEEEEEDESAKPGEAKPGTAAEEVDSEYESEEEDEDDDEEEGDADDSKQKAAHAKKIETDNREAKKSAEEEEDDDEEGDDEEDDESETEEAIVRQQMSKVTAKAKDEQTTQKKTPVVEGESEEESGEDDDDNEEEESGEEEEDDDDEEEEEEEEETTSAAKRKVKLKQDSAVEFTTMIGQHFGLEDFEAEEEGELGFLKNEVLNILNCEGDWWLAENEKGEQGRVPNTRLQRCNKFRAVQEDDEEEEFDEEEDGVDGTPHLRRKKRGKELWGSIKKAVTETTVSDVLHAMGAVPSGFRTSTLSKAFNEGDTFRMANYFSPKLSTSNLSYKDLFFDPSTNKIRPRKTKVERIITLLSCQQIPHPGSGIQVLSRHVRMCLFDGQNIISNIHTVRIPQRVRNERDWSFSTRVSDDMNTSEHAEMFVRTNNLIDNIGILFELCICYIRESTHEKGEFSCGWVHLPLIDEDGAIPANKNFNVQVRGGTPYEKGVEVDPSISRRTSSNALVSLISGNKQPRLLVRVSVPKAEQRAQLDLLPECVVGNMALLSQYSHYRQILADSLLRDRLDLESTELIHSPVLAMFPSVADQPDMMQLLREMWMEKLRTVRKSDKRDEEFMKSLFKKSFMESVYPLSQVSTLPPYRMGDTDVEEKRLNEITDFKTTKVSKNSLLAAMLSSDIEFTPFYMQEVSFNVIGPHCLLKPVHVATVES